MSTQRGGLLRLSVTDRCNLRCSYCLPDGAKGLTSRDQIPSLEALAAMAAWLVEEMGVSRIKLTGGEPLVRSGMVDFVARLRHIPGVTELSLTTNGVLLAPVALPLRQAGLDRVTVSLDTTRPARFAELTRGGRLERTLSAIWAAKEAGLAPLKLNAVLLASGWREDLPGLLDLAAELGAELRLIELMAVRGGDGWADAERVPAYVVRRWLEERATLHDAPTAVAAPARRTTLAWGGRLITVGWITPESQPFCAHCDRLRLDVRGQLRRCLMDPRHFDLRGALAIGPQHARVAMHAYLAGKRPPSEMVSEVPMMALGG